MKIIANQTEYDVPVDHWQFDHKARARWHKIRIFIYGVIVFILLAWVTFLAYIVYPDIEWAGLFEWALDCQHWLVENCQPGANGGGIFLLLLGLPFAALFVLFLSQFFGGDSSPDELI